MAEKYYVTTPIYYPSGKLHIGNAYTTVAADTLARLKRMQGFDVMFLTGTDEHGKKIADRAAAAGKSPKEFVDEQVAEIKKLWSFLNISYDRYVRTTDDYHERAVAKVYQKLYDQGDIYKHEYEGLYCVDCEAFWTEQQAKDGLCPDCGRPIHKEKEESYFFKLSNYADRLIKYYEEHPDFLEPQSRVNEMMNNFIKPGLKDLCVSRSTFDWGVKLPFDQKHVSYVWIDALLNYISALGYGSEDESAFEKFWPADVQLVGKDIVRFHAIIWPILLMALDLPLPKKVLGHGWLLLEGGKLSKSKGKGASVVDPYILGERYGVDAVRYALMREMPAGGDWDFSNESLINRINGDLANDLGNLVSRTAAMSDRYFGGELAEGGEGAPIDDELRALSDEVVANYTKLMDEYQFASALSEAWRLIGRANKYIDETTPWALAKDEAKKPRLLAVLKNLCEAIRVAAILIAPVMPDTANSIFDTLGVGEGGRTWSAAKFESGESCHWRTTTAAPLFPRIDVQKELEEITKIAEAEAAKKAASEPKAEEKPSEKAEDDGIITIDDFMRTDLRAAKVLSVEPVEKSDKLYKIQVDLGFERRQIVSGIRAWYAPEDLVGKTIVVVANLKPAKLRGEMSNGMLLAADNDGAASVIFLPDEVKAGERVH